jgi:nucleoside 2-deoxyribosyltransferase
MTFVYIAGPLFTESERNYLEKIEKAINELGYETYLPHRDGGIFKRGESKSEDFFKKDIEAIKKCKILVAVLNGSDVDSGTSWELGFAFSKAITIYGLLDDTRKPSKDLLNPMISSSISKIACSMEELKIILSIN